MDVDWVLKQERPQSSGLGSVGAGRGPGLSFSLNDSAPMACLPSYHDSPYDICLLPTPAESPGSFTQTDFWASSLAYRIRGLELCILKNHPQIMLYQTKLENHNKQIGIIKGHCPRKEAGKCDFPQTWTSPPDTQHCCFPVSWNGRVSLLSPSYGVLSPLGPSTQRVFNDCWLSE